MSGLKLLALFAHPDDEAFPVGGALAAHASRGVEIRLITATLGEEGEIRQEGAATRETLPRIRGIELSCAVRALGLASHRVLGYRDSGMVNSPANSHPKAYVNAPSAEVVEQFVAEIRTFKPQVILTFEPGGLYGHPDHIAVSQHASEAFNLAGNPEAFPSQLVNGVEPHQPQRLFQSARPKGFRTMWATKLRASGVDFPMPTPEQEEQGTPVEDIHLDLDVDGHLKSKMACILCHRTQVAADWPYHRVPREVTASILGREFYIRANPPVQPGEKVSEDFFAGLAP